MTKEDFIMSILKPSLIGQYWLFYCWKVCFSLCLLDEI